MDKELFDIAINRLNSNQKWFRMGDNILVPRLSNRNYSLRSYLDKEEYFCLWHHTMFGKTFAVNYCKDGKSIFDDVAFLPFDLPYKIINHPRWQLQLLIAKKLNSIPKEMDLFNV